MYKLISNNNGLKQYLVSKVEDIDNLEAGFGFSAYCIQEGITYWCDWDGISVTAVWYPDFVGAPYEQKLKLSHTGINLKKGEETPIIKPRDPKLQEVSI